MLILTLNHFEADFLSDGILQGLNYWGKENKHSIQELPIVRHVHNLVDQAYLLADGTQGFTGPTQDLTRNAPPLSTMTEEEVLDRWNEFDLFVMTSLRAYAREALRKVCHVSGKHPKELPLVACDGDDAEYIDFPYLKEIQPKILFKRELRRREARFSPTTYAEQFPVWPLPFAAHYQNLPELDEEKIVDIFCSMGRTHQTRDKLITVLLQAIPQVNCSHHLCYDPHDGIPDPYSLLRGRLDWDGYMRMMAGARISFAVRGWGRDTLHYWEGFMSGAAMMVADPGLIIPYPFTPHTHYIPIEDPYTDVPGLLNLYLKLKPEYLVEKAAAAKEHCLRYHTTERRAEYLIDLSMKVLSGETIDPEEFGL